MLSSRTLRYLLIVMTNKINYKQNKNKLKTERLKKELFYTLNVIQSEIILTTVKNQYDKHKPNKIYFNFKQLDHIKTK